MTAKDAATRVGYAARSELALREALETLCRDRWSGARVVHEIVMGEGRVRADVAAIATDHLVAFEVKGRYDNTMRLLHQVGMFQLCMPEVWMVVDDHHGDDARLVHHLLPSVGVLEAPSLRPPGGAMELNVVAEAHPRPVVPEMMLRVLWASELRQCCADIGAAVSAKTPRARLVAQLLAVADVEALMPLVCRRLRARDALWRADAPVLITAE